MMPDLLTAIGIVAYVIGYAWTWAYTYRHGVWQGPWAWLVLTFYLTVLWPLFALAWLHEAWEDRRDAR